MYSKIIVCTVEQFLRVALCQCVKQSVAILIRFRRHYIVQQAVVQFAVIQGAGVIAGIIHINGQVPASGQGQCTFEMGLSGTAYPGSAPA